MPTPIRLAGSGSELPRAASTLAMVVDRVPGAPALPVAAGIAAAALEPGDGEVLLSSFEGPLATRFAYGVGRVTVFALDYTAHPFNDWGGTPQFCLFLADVDAIPDVASSAPQIESAVSLSLSKLLRVRFLRTLQLLTDLEAAQPDAPVFGTDGLSDDPDPIDGSGSAGPPPPPTDKSDEQNSDDGSLGDDESTFGSG